MEIDNNRPPFFIIGCPRSGTTLFQLLIDKHPRICIPPESALFINFGPYLASTEIDFSNRRNKELLASAILEHHFIKNWFLDIKTEELAADNIRDSRSFVNALFNHYQRKFGKSRWGEKTPQHAFCADHIVNVFPDAKFIHLVRDGRDVAESTRRVFIGPQSIFNIARRWKFYVDHIADLAKNLPQEQFLQVRYEDLITDTETVLKSVYSFLGEETTVDCSTNQESTTGDVYKKRLLATYTSAIKPLNSDKIGIYKKALSQKQIAQFEYVAGEQLKHLGYELHSDATMGFSVTDKIVSIYEDHIFRYCRKIFSRDGRQMLRTQVVDLIQRKLTRRKLDKHLKKISIT